MGMSFLSYLMVLLMLAGGGRGGLDMLDLANIDSYWQLKHITVTVDQLKEDAGPDRPVAKIDALLKDLQSADFATRDKAKKSLESMGAPVIPQLKPAMDSKDPEVAAVAADLVKRFSERGQERAIRRLMAIRTLGEHKEKDALPLLNTLIDSKELFVADYARRAIAQISGTAVEDGNRQKEFAHDVALMPKNLSMLFHTQSTGGNGQFFDKLIDDTLAAMKQDGDVTPDMLKKIDKAQIQLALTRRILSVVELVGNIRMDGATVGVSDSIGGEGGWAIINLRGQYNAPLVCETLKPFEGSMEFSDGTQPATRPAKPAPQPGDIPEVDLGSTATFLFPSNDSLIIIAGDSKKEIESAVQTTLAALKAGKGTLAENADLAAALKLIDAKDPLWGIIHTNDAIKKLGIFDPFDIVTLESTRTKEGSLAYTFKAEGSAADEVKAAADELTKDIKEASDDVAMEAAQMKSLQPAVEFFQAMKVAADGKKATFTGEMKPNVLLALLSILGGPGELIEMLMEPDAPDAPNGAAVEEVTHNPITGTDPGPAPGPNP